MELRELVAAAVITVDVVWLSAAERLMEALGYPPGAGFGRGQDPEAPGEEPAPEDDPEYVDDDADFAPPAAAALEGRGLVWEPEPEAAPVWLADDLREGAAVTEASDVRLSAEGGRWRLVGPEALA
jgi:hypothetical protein